MEIVHFCPRPSFSGLESYALLLAADQKQQGHSVKFVVLPDSPLEIKCKELGITSLALTPQAKWGKDFFSGSSEKRILHLHSTLDLRHLSPWLQLSRLNPWLTANTLPTKVILQTHIWIDHKKRDLFHRLLYWAIDELWCSSTFARDNLAKLLPVPIEKIKVVNYGRNVSEMLPQILSKTDARAKFGLAMDAIVIGSVNRIDPGKGTRELVEGIIPLLMKNKNLVLVWIGPPTGQDKAAELYNENLMAFYKTLTPEIRARIVFTGAVPDAYRFLRAFDGYILPTYKECFSLGMLESQLAGVPVMGTNSGGTPEVVCEGKTGWLFAPQSASAVTDVVNRFLTDKDKWTTFAEAAHKRILADFDYKKISPLVLRMYEA